MNGTSMPLKVTPADVIRKLQVGNERFVEGKVVAGGLRKDALVQDPLTQTASECTIIADAACEYPFNAIFDAPSGFLKPVRVCGGSLEANDSIVGSVEYLIDYFHTPVLLVMGNYNNDPIKIAVKKAMKQAGRDDAPCSNGATDLEDLPLIDRAMPAARDSVAQGPRNSFEELVHQAAIMNVWRNIETILSSSVTIARAATLGELEVHGAFLDVQTRKVAFLGKHPLQDQILSKPPKAIVIRTAKDPPVPSSEALASLVAGNKRYTTGHGGTNLVNDCEVKGALCSSGQNPIAVIVGCADSRAPIEIIFDMKPGDLFVLRNAGNSCNDKATCNMKGSMDYAIKILRCKLVVVMGHTQCGAVTAAVSAVKEAAKGEAVNNATNAEGPSGIGTVLSYIEAAAMRAVKELPDATLEEQVVLATQYNVQDTVKKLIERSKIANDAVTSLDLQVHGAIYDLFSGEVRWLGQHPQVEELVPNMPVELHRWHTRPYTPMPVQSSPGRNNGAKAMLKRLIEGNQRFVEDSAVRYATSMDQGSGDHNPLAVILSSSELGVPAEAIFDQEPNSLLVQRTMGGICATALEFAYLKYRPHVFVVLASPGQLPEVALEQLMGSRPPSEAMQRVLSDVMESTLETLWQVDKNGTETQAGRLSLITAITVELNAWTVIQRLISQSAILRNAIKSGDLEIHVAALAARTGRAEFLGEHPMLNHLMSLNMS